MDTTQTTTKTAAPQNALIARRRALTAALPGLTIGTGCDELDIVLAEQHRAACKEIVALQAQAEAVAMRLLVEVRWTVPAVAERVSAEAEALVREFYLGAVL